MNLKRGDRVKVNVVEFQGSPIYNDLVRSQCLGTVTVISRHCKDSRFDIYYVNIGKHVISVYEIFITELVPYDSNIQTNDLCAEKWVTSWV